MQNQTIRTLKQRGTLTLPKDVREKYGFKEGDQLVLEEGEGGLVLRIACTFPIETYTDERVAALKRRTRQHLPDSSSSP